MNVLNRIAPLPAQKLLLGISLFFWCGAMHLYWPNNGGSGLSLPLNITSWIYAVVLAASALMLVPRQRWRITVPAAGFMVGAFILSLLCLQTPVVWQAEALLVAGALLGGVSVYLVTLQIPLTANTLTALLALLWGRASLNVWRLSISTGICRALITGSLPGGAVRGPTGYFSRST